MIFESLFVGTLMGVVGAWAMISQREPWQMVVLMALAFFALGAVMAFIA